MTWQPNWSKIRWWAWRCLRVAGAVYVGLLLLLWGFQRTLIYFPTTATAEQMRQEAEALGVEAWAGPDGRLIGWRSKAHGQSPAANRMLVFHGNTGNALQRTHYIRGFETLRGGSEWQVFLFEYPGFGSRAGSISEGAFISAAGEALRDLDREDARPIYLLGESLGSGLACATAATHADQVKGVMLITPYGSLGEVASYHYPIFPIHFILRDQWNNAAALPRFHGRVAVLLAGADATIPPAQGRRLFDSAHEPKKLWVFPGADHNELDFSPLAAWWEEASAFLLEPASP